MAERMFAVITRMTSPRIRLVLFILEAAIVMAVATKCGDKPFRWGQGWGD